MKPKGPAESKEDVQTNYSNWDEILTIVNRNIIGGNLYHEGSFGPRKITYLDSTASGKSLECIEEFIKSSVLNYYGNTHTEATLTAKQTTLYREEARKIIKKSINGSDDDICILYGSGTTPCVHKLVHAVCHAQAIKPIVLIGPFEHHSNILPWRESGSQVINLPQDKYGLIDLKRLETELLRITSNVANRNKRIIGCFSAGSNVTGMVSDDIKLTQLMHRFGGYAFFDYAAAAPHVQINMNPEVPGKDKDFNSALAQKDALFFSGHKFLGGPQTCGVLVMKKHVFWNRVPHGAGGGTIFFVTPVKHAYLEDFVEREEGGTPSIVQSIRLGLVFKVISDIGIRNIIRREAKLTQKALLEWSKTPNIVILGNTIAPRLPIISFLIVHPQTGYYLHYNFVVKLLNDLFGIQCRGGCMCAGPYAQILLGIDTSLAENYVEILSQERNAWLIQKSSSRTFDVIFRPGFVRISLSFHLSDTELEFVINAVKFVAKHGWEFMTLYNMDPAKGTFHHKFENNNLNNTLSLKSFSIFNSFQQTHSLRLNQEKLPPHPHSLYDYLTLAKTELKIIRQWVPNIYVPNDKYNLNPKSQKLRWFLLPSEVVYIMQNRKAKVEQAKMPFQVDKNSYSPINGRMKKSFSKNSIIQQLIVIDDSSSWRGKKNKSKTEIAESKLANYFITFNTDSGIDTLSLSRGDKNFIK